MSDQRTIDPEHNWFWRAGYQDGIDGLLPVVPDETRHQFQRNDYFAGWHAGNDHRGVMDPNDV